MRRRKIKFTITIRADIGKESHTETKVAEFSGVANTTAEQAVTWFVSVARDGWRRWFEVVGTAMRIERTKNAPIVLRAYPAERE